MPDASLIDRGAKRDIDPNSISTIHDSMSSLRSNGFLNYYGMQRFGTAPIPTHLIGLALLRSEWELAVDLIMSEREGEFEDIALARQQWKEGKRDDARRNMPRRCTAERSVMEAYKKGNDKDHLGALSSVSSPFSLSVALVSLSTLDFLSPKRD
jgi:tRNA pseudouridine13 synthase